MAGGHPKLVYITTDEIGISVELMQGEFFTYNGEKYRRPSSLKDQPALFHLFKVGWMCPMIVGYPGTHGDQFFDVKCVYIGENQPKPGVHFAFVHTGYKRGQAESVLRQIMDRIFVPAGQFVNSQKKQKKPKDQQKEPNKVKFVEQVVNASSVPHSPGGTIVVPPAAKMPAEKVTITPEGTVTVQLSAQVKKPRVRKERALSDWIGVMSKDDDFFLAYVGISDINKVPEPILRMVINNISNGDYSFLRGVDVAKVNKLLDSKASKGVSISAETAAKVREYLGMRA